MIYCFYFSLYETLLLTFTGWNNILKKHLINQKSSKSTQKINSRILTKNFIKSVKLIFYVKNYDDYINSFRMFKPDFWFVFQRKMDYISSRDKL